MLAQVNVNRLTLYYIILLLFLCNFKIRQHSRYLKMESDGIIASFSAFVKSIESETKILKCLSNLRTIDSSSETMVSLREVEENVCRLEEDFERLEAMLDEEESVLVEFESLCALCKDQSLRVQRIQSMEVIHHAKLSQTVLTTSVPTSTSTSCSSTSSAPAAALKAHSQQHTSKPKSATAVTTLSKTSVPFDNKALVTMVSEDISPTEFEALSKTTRGRLQISTVNKSFKVLQDMVLKKKKVNLSSPPPPLSPASPPSPPSPPPPAPHSASHYVFLCLQLFIIDCSFLLCSSFFLSDVSTSQN